MTPQEQQMLQDLTDRINKTQLTEKDPEAERFIFQALGRNSDSLYIMAQTILVQQYALDQAKKQLDDAKQQVDDLGQQLEQARQQPQKHTSFLGSLLGTDDSRNAPPPPPPSQYNQQQYQPVQNYAPPQQYGQPQYGQPQYGQPGLGGPPPSQFGGGGFLRSAMTTATGVAAGALAFEGIESLMHGFGHSGGGYGGEGFGSGFGGQPREEIVNNYYGDSGSIGDRAERSGGLSPDLEDRRDDSGRDFSASDNSSDTSGDYGMDDSGSDDSSSGDDYGSDDNS